MAANVYSFRANLGPGVTGSGYVKGIEAENELLWFGVTVLGVCLVGAMIAYSVKQQVTQQLSGSGINSYTETPNAYLRRA